MILRPLTPRPDAPPCPAHLLKDYDQFTARDWKHYRRWRRAAFFPACHICGCVEHHACEGGCWWIIEGELCSSCFARVPGADLKMCPTRMEAAGLAFEDVIERDSALTLEEIKDGAVAPLLAAIWAVVWPPTYIGPCRDGSEDADPAEAEAFLRRCFGHYDLDAVFNWHRATLAETLLEIRYGDFNHWPLLLCDRPAAGAEAWPLPPCDFLTDNRFLFFPGPDVLEEARRHFTALEEVAS